MAAVCAELACTADGENVKAAAGTVLDAPAAAAAAAADAVIGSSAANCPDEASSE